MFDLKEYLELQLTEFQGPFKVSYLLKEPSHAILPLVRKRLRQSGLAAIPHLKCHWYLDVVPLRASRAEAIRFLTLRWGISLDKVLVVASQQGDDELIRGLTTNVIPFDHDSSLDGLRTQQRVFFSDESVVDVDGLFNITIDTITSGLYTFYHEPEFQYIIIDENDNLQIRLNTLDFDESLVYTGKGSSKNNFLMDVFLRSENDELEINSKLDLSLDAFKNLVDSLYKGKMASKIEDYYDNGSLKAEGMQIGDTKCS